MAHWAAVSVVLKGNGLISCIQNRRSVLLATTLAVAEVFGSASSSAQPSDSEPRLLYVMSSALKVADEGAWQDEWEISQSIGGKITGPFLRGGSMALGTAKLLQIGVPEIDSPRTVTGPSPTVYLQVSSEAKRKFKFNVLFVPATLCISQQTVRSNFGIENGVMPKHHSDNHSQGGLIYFGGGPTVRREALFMFVKIPGRGTCLDSFTITSEIV